MCVEKVQTKTIAKKATVLTAAGEELTGVTIMGPVEKVQDPLAGYKVRLYGREITGVGSSPWVVITAAQDRDKRQILL